MRPHPVLVSVIIPAYNSAHAIGEQLGALSNQDYEGSFEVVVADNGSTDTTVEVAREFAGVLDLRVVDASTRRGAGPARNGGVAAARGELLAFADADDVASANWLGKLVAAAREWDIVAGPYEYEMLNSPAVQLWRRPQPSDRLPVVLRFLPFALGGNFAIWRDAFESLQGFRAGASNDVEFSWRAQLFGYQIGFTGDAVMHHRSRSTLRSHARQFLRWGDAHCGNYRQFRDSGIPRGPQWRAIGGMARCLLQGPVALTNRHRRGMWIGEFMYKVGRVRGSIRHRVLFL
jgi:glycosyltransferase involved in cell wall biosynthesis